MASVNITLAGDLKGYADVNQDLISQQILYPQDKRFISSLPTFTTAAKDGEEVGLPNFELSEVTQPYQSAYTPKGEADVEAVKIVMRGAKIDHTIEPELLRGKWVAHLRQLGYDEAKAKAEMPFTRYILDRLIEKHLDEKEIYGFSGAHVTPTPGTAEPAAEIMDGLKTLLAAAISSGDLAAGNVFGLGSYVAADTFEYLESFFDALPERYKNVQMDVLCAPQVATDYYRDRRNTFNYKMEESELMRIDGSMLTLKPVVGLTGSKRLIAVPPGLIVRMIGNVGPGENMDVQPFERIVKVLTDWTESVGFSDWRHVFCNDQA